MIFQVDSFTFEVISEDEHNVSLRTADPGVFGNSTSYADIKPAIRKDVQFLFVPEVITHEGIEYTVTQIVEDVFRNLSQLRELHLPASLTSFYWCLWGCNNLQNIIVDEKNEKYVSLDGVLFEKRQDKPYKLIAYPTGRGGSYKLPNGVKHIDSKAFKCCKIDGLELCANLDTIGNNVFYRCSNLQELILPDKIRKIGKCQDDTTVTYVYKGARYNAEQIYDAVSADN